MKLLLKKSLSFILAITIIFSSAIVGLGEIDFVDVGELVKKMTPDFSVTSHAASVSDLTFAISSDGNSYSVTGCSTSASGSLAIPSTYNGKPVTSIGNWAFSNCTILTSIAIPGSVTSIDDHAFYKCSALDYVFCTGSESDWANISIGSSNTPLTDAVIHYNSTDHTYGDWIIDVEPTCTEDGERYHVCSVCDYSESTIALATGHYFTDGYYTVCEAEQLFEYSIENDCVTITGYLGTDTDVVIPAAIEGVPVKFIGEDAFSYSKINSVIIPDTVTNIDTFAFYGCKNLTSVAIGNNVTNIGCYAFSDCINLTSITIPDSVITIDDSAFHSCTNLAFVTISDSVEDIHIFAFYNCANLLSFDVDENNLNYSSVDGVLFNKDKTTLLQYPAGKEDTKYIIPDTVSYIYDNAFYQADNLTSVKFSDSLKRIGNEAFSSCDNLTSITIPESVNSIGGFAFGGCKKLKKINVKEDNLFYSSVDGVLFNKNKTKLIQYPLGKTVTSYEIPGSVTIIDYCAFDGCSSLTSLTIGKDVISIGVAAFDGCNAITDVYYRGLISDWDNISIGSDNECLTNANISHLCTLGDWVIDTEATCTEEGSRSKTCLVCGDIAETEIIEQLGHDYSTEWTIDVAPTCIESGSKSHHCINCEAKTDITIISATGHTAVKDIAVSATCTTSGKTEGSHCSVCGQVIKSQRTIPATGHDFSSWETINSPTCTSTGEKYRECYGCNYYEYETISATGHAYSSQWTIDVAATCTESGSKSHHCTRCDDKKDVTTISATGHDYSYWYTDFSPTCTTTGQNYRYCFDCYHYDYETIPELGHDYSPWETYDSPTCTMTGEKRQYCYNCYEYNYGDVPAKGHSYSSNWTIDKASTCSAYGSKSHHCIYCDAKKDTTKIKPIPHKFSGWVTIAKPTATSMGQQKNECAVCDYVDYRVICAAPKLKSVSNTANGVKFTWEKVKGAKTYLVYRKTGSGKWVQIAKGVKSNNYTDKTAKSGTTYKYSVKAVTEFGVVSSYYTSGLRIKCLADPTLKTPSSTKKGIVLKWNKITGAEGYIIYRKTGSGKYTKLATVKGVSKVSYTDKSAKKGKKYTYKVKAYYSKTYSAYSNAKTIKDKY